MKKRTKLITIIVSIVIVIVGGLTLLRKIEVDAVVSGYLFTRFDECSRGPLADRATCHSDFLQSLGGLDACIKQFRASDNSLGVRAVRFFGRIDSIKNIDEPALECNEMYAISTGSIQQCEHLNSRTAKLCVGMVTNSLLNTQLLDQCPKLSDNNLKPLCYSRPFLTYVRALTPEEQQRFCKEAKDIIWASEDTNARFATLCNPQQQASEPVAFTKNDQLFTVSTKEFSVADQFSAASLAAQSQECGTNLPQKHFENLMALYANDKGKEYVFQYNRKTQEPNVWTVRVIPNKPGYAILGDFQKDFSICAAGGDHYPSLLSSQYLLFISSCGTGFDDSSGLPHGCDLVRKFVEPTLKIE